ncbi:MAG: hypothetical protein AAGL19_05640 [Pseudomonadota bacterium]
MKDTYEVYDPHQTQAVAEYEAKVAMQRRRQERDGAAVMMMFLPLASAADPRSALGRFTRWAPVFIIALISAFAVGVATGYI